MVSILNIRLDLLTKSELEQKLEYCLHGNTLRQIATINPEFLLYAHAHPVYQAILNSCDLNIIDGKGVQLAIFHKYKVLAERIPGVDLVLLLMKLAEQNKLKVLFLGGKEGVAQKAASRVKIKYPDLTVKGLSGGHIQKINDFWKQDKNIFECINNYKPDILIVGLGHPKQEEWIADHKKLLSSVKIAIGAGGTIDYLSGNIPRAPIFFRNLGLEWLYRLFVEPWRYKRIFQALIIFPITYFMNTKTIESAPEVRTRFAPSPTGFLHIGGLRTALYNYLYAKQHKGKFILRIEDTDQERLVPNAQQQLIQTLKSFNLEFDEGPGIEGKYGPYIQSQRLHLYQKYVQELLDKKAAYYCFCTTERLQKLREVQEQAHQSSKYDRHCFHLPAEEIDKKIKNNESYVVRLRIPEGRISFKDLIRGEVSVDNQVLDDQIILKSDGYPTYHLANVVDDHLMKITHVIRGEEWIPSTPKHIILYQAFGWMIPEFSHLPLLLNSDKSKLSKRQGDVAAEDYLQKGYLPDALLNFIALLGWNPGTDDEIFTLSDLINKFKLEKVQKSGAVLNVQKLNWMNAEYIKNKSLETIVPLVEKYLLMIPGFEKEKYNIQEVVSLCRERLETLAQIGEQATFLYKLPEYVPEILIAKKSTLATTVQSLQVALLELEKYQADWQANNLKIYLDEKRETHNLSRAEMFWPLRVAVSGQTNSPDVFEIMQVLKKTESLSRISKALEKISKV